MRKLAKAFVLGALVVFTANCAPSYRSEFNKLSDRKGWTAEQRKAALEYSYRYFGKENEDGKYAVLYSRLPKKEVVAQLDMFVADLDGLLGYKDEETDQYLKAHGLRPHFEHQEEVFKAIQARVRVAELHDTFEQMLGKSSYSSSRDEFGHDHSTGYSPSILALDLDELKEKFPFRNQVLEEAKEQGLLKEISRYTLSQSWDMAYKEPDPNFPDDKNKFVWRKRSYQLEVVTFKVLDPNNGQPRDNSPNYAEVFRLVEGKREATPAVRAFMDGRGRYAVAVIDVHQAGKIGNGLPDAVEQLSERQLADADMIARIFPEDNKTKRVEPKLPPVRVEIKPIGTEIDLWEVSKDAAGWKVPFTYQSRDGDNYTISLRFKKPKKGEPRPEGPASRLKEVEYIEKRWAPTKPGAGEVVEYFVPKAPFNKPVLAARVVTSYDMPVKLEFVFPDGTEEVIIVTPGPNKAIEDKPEAIGYNWLDKRYLIKDFDGNGSYEKRREVGELSSSSYGYYGARAMDDFGGGGHHDEQPAQKPKEPEDNQSDMP